ncbi:MAG TPA: adenosylmethionine--8-amino-7-oxononanoate transaminase [Tepidisphaeraceae bacterium]|jgi:adenosylmethionine-8-amino-7-oxononanoate aminotransferase|nr:adenosylmethionine--8-amino-7-oxononanoate transaminase [Tepidisphaeraceae bacterium]
MTRPTEALRNLDRQRLWHPFTPMRQWIESDPLIIVSADGMHLIDSDGQRYLDGVSSLWCNVHGHRVPEIDNAIRAQLDKVAHTTLLGLSSEPAIVLGDRLMRIVPDGLSKIFYSDSGATATEVAFKMAAQYWYNVGQPQKTEFVGFTEAYHGDTFGAMSVGRTDTFHRAYLPMLFKVHFAPTPFPYRFQAAGVSGTDSNQLSASQVGAMALWELEKILERNSQRLAAVCIEPIVQGAAGMIVHPPGFLGGVRELCTKHDVLLIADEVAVGFGRTGKMFACEHEGVSPDLMCVAKGITGGYLPLAATFATQRIFDAFLGDTWQNRTFFHGHTYTGNPLAAAAALASLDLFEKNQVVAAVAEKSGALAAMLEALRDLPHVGDIRQKGLMVGIELVEEKTTRRPFDPKRRVGAGICMSCRKHGIIIRPLGDVVVLMPPLAMGVEDLRKLVDAVRFEVEALP